MREQLPIYTEFPFNFLHPCDASKPKFVANIHNITTIPSSKSKRRKPSCGIGYFNTTFGK
nr:hypothetical protein [uncultured bacterium]AOE08301.1 hypothetical protein [uncultured bacterium]